MSVRQCIKCKHNFEHNGTKRNGLCGSSQTVLNCDSYEPLDGPVVPKKKRQQYPWIKDDETEAEAILRRKKKLLSTMRSRLKDLEEEIEG